MSLRRKVIALSIFLSLMPFALFGYLFYASVDNQYSALNEEMDEFHGSFMNITKENITALVDSYIDENSRSYAVQIEEHIEKARDIVNTEAAYIEYMIENNITADGIDSYTMDSPPPGVFYSDYYGQNISLNSSVYLLQDSGNSSLRNYSDMERDINITALMDPLWASLYNHSDIPLLWFYISTESGVHRSYPWHRGYAFDYDARIRSWYQNSTANVTFSPPYYGVSGGGLQISVNRAIYVNGEKYGVVAIDLSIEGLTAIPPPEKSSILNRTFIIDSSGNAMSHPSLIPYIESLMERENLTWRDDIPLVNITDLESNSTAFEAVLSNITSGMPGQVVCSYGGGEKYLNYMPINGTDWILVVVINGDEVETMKDSFMQELQSFQDSSASMLWKSRDNTFNFMFPLIFFIALLSLAISMMFVDSLVYPVISLKEEVDRVSEDIDHPVMVRGTGEIQDLALSFERMRLQLKDDMGEMEKNNRILEVQKEHLIRFQEDLMKKTERLKHLSFANAREAEAREAMLNIFAHKLRTPLTAISVNMQLMERELQGEVTAKARKRLESMSVALEKLTDIVNDTLLLSTLYNEDYEITRESFSADEMLEDALKHVPSIAERSQILKKDISVEKVVAERSLLTRAVREVLLNASHYSPPDSVIEVIMRREKGGVHITVKDSGPGIPSEELKTIFEPFNTGKELKNSNFEHLHIGLATVKLIVERHDGNMWIESGDNGTSVHIWIAQPDVDANDKKEDE